MHIEPGILAPAKLSLAAATASAIYLRYLPALVKQPVLWLRTALAALFFSLFMQMFHLQVGPSELHFVGAMPIYLCFGFLPTLFGFGIGLLLQGLLFEPQDLVHLAVNSLSLAVPLMAVHFAQRGKAVQTSVRNILKLDATYYAGVTAMVGFWLALADQATPFAAWLQFAASYLFVVACEPCVTFVLANLLQRHGHRRWVAHCCALPSLA